MTNDADWSAMQRNAIVIKDMLVELKISRLAQKRGDEHVELYERFLEAVYCTGEHVALIKDKSGFLPALAQVWGDEELFQIKFRCQLEVNKLLGDDSDHWEFPSRLNSSSYTKALAKIKEDQTCPTRTIGVAIVDTRVDALSAMQQMNLSIRQFVQAIEKEAVSIWSQCKAHVADDTKLDLAIKQALGDNSRFTRGEVARCHDESNQRSRQRVL